jgi:uncharacterized protein YlbG (UPF0298 family)
MTRLDCLAVTLHFLRPSRQIKRRFLDVLHSSKSDHYAALCRDVCKIMGLGLIKVKLW